MAKLIIAAMLATGIVLSQASFTDEPHLALPPPSPNAFFALCFDTQDSEKRSLEQQAALLAELGYAGAGHVGLDQVPERIETLEAAGLKLFQVYVFVSIAPDTQAYDPGLRDTLALLEAHGTMVCLLIRGGAPSDRAGDPKAVQVVREIADFAQEHDLRVALYPHSGFWLERVEDALRVVEKADRPNVGVMFNLCHWLKVDDESNLRPLLAGAIPHLYAVTVHGADRAVDIQAGAGNWIQPLGNGSFDVQGLLDVLGNLEYTGPIGLQCWGIQGDARDHLARSMATWRRLNERKPASCPPRGDLSGDRANEKSAPAHSAGALHRTSTRP